MRLDVPTPDEMARSAPSADEREAERARLEEMNAPLTPAERSSLNFLRMNTPVSLLVCIAAGLFTVMLVPSIHYVFRSQPTYFTMAPRLLFTFAVVLLLFQIGFCVLALVTQSVQTQRCIVQGTGSRLALENYLLALWLLCRVTDTSATMMLGAGALFAIAVMSGFNAIVLSYKHQARWMHPLEMLLVHLPNKMMLLLAGQVLLWDQLMLAWGWDRSNGREALGQGLWLAIGVQVALGIALAVHCGATFDISVWAVSMFLDGAVLKFHKMPIIGPNSRPFALTVIMVVSMVVRTLALVIPNMLQNGFLVVCHTHRRHTPHDAYPEASLGAPGASDEPAEAGRTLPAPEEVPSASERTRLVPRKDPAYGAVP